MKLLDKLTLCNNFQTVMWNTILMWIAFSFIRNKEI